MTGCTITCIEKCLLVTLCMCVYSKTCLKQPLKNRQNKGLRSLSLNNSNSMLISFFSEILVGPLAKLNCFYTSIKNPCVGIFDNCLEFTVLDCVDNNELYLKLYNFHKIEHS